jgi:dipeptidyl aminopeptidase/acylaminoacyl peptidase
VDATSGDARELTTLKGAKIIQIITSDGTSRALQVSGKLLLLAENLRTFDDSLIEVNSDNGKYSPLVSGPFKITVARGSSNSWLISFIREAADVPPDIWLLDVHRHGVERVTHLNPFFDKTPLGEAILIKYNLPSGGVAHAALLLPPSRSAKQRVPLIVYAYGGTNKSRYIHYFGFGEVAFAEPTENMQLLATRGYAVLLPDIPIRVGTPMKDIADGVVSAANAAVRFGYADKERLGIMGHSYGGYSVYSTIVSTSMFKAAIARSGFSDWLTFYGELSDDGAAYAVNLAEMTTEGIGMGASPWAAPDLYPENSPFRYFDRVTTPVLITHGTDDNGVDDYNDKSSFVALRRLGKDVELALYGGADHNEPQWSEANQQDYLERMIGWFDRYLCPERLGDPELTCKVAP